MNDPKPPKNARRPGATKPTTNVRKIALSGPEITVSQSPMSRTTLADVSDDLRRSPWPRAPLLTVSYNDLPLDGRRERQGAPPPPPPPPPERRPMTSAPEIEVVETSAMGRETLSLLDEDDGLIDVESTDEPDPRAPEVSAEVRCDALELRTFVVPAANLSPRATDAEKTEFVRDRLAHRLPCPMSQVRRIDARLLEAGAVMLRVWCPVDLAVSGQLSASNRSSSPTGPDG